MTLFKAYWARFSGFFSCKTNTSSVFSLFSFTCGIVIAITFSVADPFLFHINSTEDFG